VGGKRGGVNEEEDERGGGCDQSQVVDGADDGSDDEGLAVGDGTCACGLAPLSGGSGG
jgi:hypothetical protein